MGIKLKLFKWSHHYYWAYSTYREQNVVTLAQTVARKAHFFYSDWIANGSSADHVFHLEAYEESESWLDCCCSLDGNTDVFVQASTIREFILALR